MFKVTPNPRLAKRPLAQRLAALALALWAFGALQLLALPSDLLVECQMACSLDGSGCCCRLGGGFVPITGEERYFSRPWVESAHRDCPQGVAPVATVVASEPEDDDGRRVTPGAHFPLASSFVAAGETTGDTLLLTVPRPPPASILL